VANYANESDAFNSALQRHSQVTSKVTAALLSFSLRRKKKIVKQNIFKKERKKRYTQSLRSHLGDEKQ
jgi:hypothetical protein